MPEIVVRDDGRGEGAGATTVPLARLVCEHNTVLWVAFAPPTVRLRTEPQPADRPTFCGCQPSVTVIFPESQ